MPNVAPVRANRKGGCGTRHGRPPQIRSMLRKNFEALTNLAVHVAIIDDDCRIVSVNRSWREFASRHGLGDPACGVGTNYAALCDAAAAQGVDGVAELGRELRGLAAGDTALVTLAYPCHGPDERRWFVLIGLPLRADGARGAALLHLDTTQLIQSEDLVRNLSPSMSEMSADPAGSLRGRILHEIEQSLDRVLPAMLHGGTGVVEARQKNAPDDQFDDAVQRLTPRQRDVLALLAQGKTNAEIARELSSSPHTIKLHVSAVLKRLGVRSRTEATKLALRPR